MKSLVLVFIAIIFLFTLSFTVQAINISDCREINESGSYALTTNIINSTNTTCFNITANDVILDCQSHLIDGNGSANTYGIYGWKVTKLINITIRNCSISGWGYGIYFYSINDSTIDSMIIHSNDNGFALISPKNNIVNNSVIANNTYFDFELVPGLDADCNNILENVNGTDNKPIVYYNATVTLENWNNNVSGIILCNADNSVLNNITLSHSDKENGLGISLLRTDNTSLTNINISHFYDGIYFRTASNNTINTSLLLYNVAIGVFLADGVCSNNNITNSIANNNQWGVTLGASGGENNYIINLTADNNLRYGLEIYSSLNNSIRKSSFSNNSYGNYTYGGVYIGSNNNILYNNFFNNSHNAVVYSSYSSLWNTTLQDGENIIGGNKIGGNFWAHPNNTGFSQTCTDANGDRICDSNYTINVYNIDYLPLASLDDVAYPDVTLNSPVYYANLSDNDIIFNCSTSDNYNLSNITLYGNFSGTWNSSVTVNISGTSNLTSFSRTLTTNASYVWNCYACDTSSNCNFSSSNRTLTVDTTNPTVHLISPADGTDTTTRSQIFKFNVTDNFNIENCSLYIDDNLNQTLEDADIDEGEQISFDSVTLPGSSSGITYEWYVKCYDYSGNSDVSEPWEVIITSSSSSQGSDNGDTTQSSSGTTKNAGNITGNKTMSNLIIGDKINFTIGNLSHTITVKNITTNSTTLEIRSTTTTTTVYINETKTFDLNNNNYNDFSITLLSITNSKASLLLKAIPEPENISNLTANLTANNISNQGGILNKTIQIEFKWIIVIIICVIAVVLLIILSIEHKKRNYWRKSKVRLRA